MTVERNISRTFDRTVERPISDNSNAPDSLLGSLVSWWSLDETSGIRYDAHGTNHLTDNNTVGYVAGKISNAAGFVPANSEYLSNFATPSLDPNGGDFTIAGWVNVNAITTGVQRIMLLSAVTTSTKRVVIVSISPDVLQLLVFNSANVFSYVDTLTRPLANTWYHILVQLDAAAATLSVSLNNEPPVTGMLGGTGILMSGINRIYIGNNHNQTLPFDGAIDEMAMWHRLLSTAEKTRLYNSGAGMGYPK